MLFAFGIVEVTIKNQSVFRIDKGIELVNDYHDVIYYTFANAKKKHIFIRNQAAWQAHSENIASIALSL